MDIGTACSRPASKSYASFALFLLLSVAPVGSQGTPVFLNELHYDNIGGDQNEGVEIAGPAGTDLSGWQVLLYNGLNGKIYERQLLNGAIPDLGAGMGVSFFSIPGIQNGSPDGMALVDDSNTLLQFLSYEGVFTATEGTAKGHLSEDIGISESSATLVGKSLQLTGTGTEYWDFSWVAGQQNFGMSNAGQVFPSKALPAPGTFILTVSGLIGCLAVRWKGLSTQPALPNSSCCSCSSSSRESSRICRLCWGVNSPS